MFHQLCLEVPQIFYSLPFTAGSYIAEGLPNITGLRQVTWGGGDAGAGGYGSTIHSGAIYASPNTGCAATVNETNYNGGGSGFGFDASRSNAIYGNSTKVQPNSLTTRYYIKF